ncbi:3'-5' exonuclease family protein [Allopontixanthobacter sediminis]|uniref:Predicted 3'-5' exonuclease PolB-like domain-containing protein n=1 Tax=Allopontixanthobacter sediminis TaxID=1689985 RepID=A0A845B1V2_9SPHN|nr:hypothetical protein [Allopontixanthobacter sediminis]MXP44410.1 hypothetical protein [Allopontixanthobacter sediminis]
MTTEPTATPMTTNLDQMALDLALEARVFFARPDTDRPAAVRTYIVADFEYKYDRALHTCYTTAEGKDAEGTVRWPFHRIVAAAWAVIRFRPGEDIAEIKTPVVLSAEAMDEREIVSGFFDALAAEPSACLVTWGGEAKDLAVLRKTAGEFGLLLPMQLRDLLPYSSRRIDLCDAVSVKANSVHLPEYAAACSIPAKPSPSKNIGRLVEAGDWPAVKDQVLADVMTPAVILVRHLTSHGIITCKPQQTVLALAEAMALALPAREYFSRTVMRWAENEVVQTKLRGKVCPPV